VIDRSMIGGEMETTVSKDGTTIAFAESGSGPAVILVAGAFGYYVFGPNVGLVPLLAEHFRAVLYDRRGRGDSGDTQPFERVREVDDLDAIIKAIGGSAFVYGISSGAALAAEAASALGPERITKLALYEPSYILEGTRAPVPSTYLPRLRELLAEGHRGDMVALFLTEAVGMPAEMVEAMGPFPPAMEQVAHTLLYDGAFMVDNQQGRLTADLRGTLEAIRVPTIVIDGGATFPFLHNTADIVGKTIRGARRHTVEGQQHDVAPEAIAPLLVQFFQE
jgi:pimeloyl-ACP methyl ester carboxylesterase